MSGIYIPMEMPKRGHTVTLTILGGGEVCVQYYENKVMRFEYKGKKYKLCVVEVQDGT